MSAYPEEDVARITILGFSPAIAEEALRWAGGNVRSAQFFALVKETGPPRQIDALALLGFPRDECQRAYVAAKQDMREAARILIGGIPKPDPALAQIALFSKGMHGQDLLRHYCETHKLAIPIYTVVGPPLGPFVATVHFNGYSFESPEPRGKIRDAKRDAAVIAYKWLLDTADQAPDS